MKRLFLIIQATIILFNISGLDITEDIDRWNNYEISSNTFLTKLENINSATPLGEDSESLYNKGVLSLYRGIIFLREEEKKKSIEQFEVTIDYAEKALMLEQKSDYYRLLAEAGSFLMLQKGVGYIIQHSKDVNDNAKKALELNPNNVKATLIVAGGLVNAPAFFGGNKKEGIKILKEAIKVPNITNEERFNILIMLAQATKDPYYANKAKEIYPNNKNAEEKLASLVR